ncbi:hypothetical protein [Spirosoma sp.]|uniref:hypothetical protein n=1 Tax=Spirosoma sp. TaxID=1899569 RepID=UPI003B3BE2BD
MASYFISDRQSDILIPSIMMTNELDIFLAIGQSLAGTERNKLFGLPCFRIDGKPFICLFHNEMVFKLTGEAHQEALSLDGAQRFDPSGKQRPMREWVQLPFDYAEKWEDFAQAAYVYVKMLP